MIRMNRALAWSTRRPRRPRGRCAGTVPDRRRPGRRRGSGTGRPGRGARGRGGTRPGGAAHAVADGGSAPALPPDVGHRTSGEHLDPRDDAHGEDEDRERPENVAPPATQPGAVGGRLAVLAGRPLPPEHGGPGGPPGPRLDPHLLDLLTGAVEQMLEDGAARGRHHAHHTGAQDRPVDAEFGGEDRRGDGRQCAAGHMGHAQFDPSALELSVAVGLAAHLPPRLDIRSSLQGEATDKRSRSFRFCRFCETCHPHWVSLRRIQAPIPLPAMNSAGVPLHLSGPNGVLWRALAPLSRPAARTQREGSEDGNQPARATRQSCGRLHPGRPHSSSGRAATQP